jgi:hypothetical protein
LKVLTLSPHKPIIYPPGIISLVLLPVFCLVFLNQHKAFVHQYAMDVTMYDPDWNAKKIPGIYHPLFPPVRDYLDINLDGNDAANKTRLDFARLEIREILDSKDIHKGVKFHFGKTSKYWSYVQAYDICQVEDAPAYGQYRDDMYVMYVRPKVYNNEETSSRFLFNDLIMLPPSPEELNQRMWDKRLQLIGKITKGFWPIGIAFLTMSFFAIRKLFFKS